MLPKKAYATTRANPVPALIPSSPGSAMAFRVTPCIIAPACDIAAPTKIAAIMRGSLMSKITS